MLMTLLHHKKQKARYVASCFIFILFFLTLTDSSFSKKVNQETVDTRIEASRIMYESINRCIESVRSYQYWQEVTECLQTHKVGQSRKCTDKVSHTIVYKESDYEHCLILKPKKVDVESLFKEMLKKKGL